jgi:hypothetical protein
MPDAAALYARLRADGHEVYPDEADRTALRVSPPISPVLAAEITAAKAELLALLLEADALAEEVARMPSPFGDGPLREGASPVMLVRYECRRVPRWVSQSGWWIKPVGSDG